MSLLNFIQNGVDFANYYLQSMINQQIYYIIIARLEAEGNDITATKYGINQFPIVALFFPGSQRIVDVYQGMRQSDHMANWLNQACPKIEIENDDKIEDKKEKNKNDEKLEIDMEKINKKNELTEKKEFIKAKFFELQKKLDEIEKNININNNTISKNRNNSRRHKKIRITFDFNFTNIFITGITLLIIFAFYQTGRKLLINSGFHKD